jgi:hypothetical protein
VIAGLGRWFFDWGGVVFGIGTAVSLMACIVALGVVMDRDLREMNRRYPRPPKRKRGQR